MKIKGAAIAESMELILKKNAKKINGDMRPEYDFSNGVRGKFFRLSESQKMIPLDVDIIRHFQRRSRKEKKAYYILINETLRRAMNDEKAGGKFYRVAARNDCR